MTLHTRETVLRHWSHPGIVHYRDQGDFFSLEGLKPTRNHRQLMRGPGWSAFTPTPAGLDTIRAVLYDKHSDYFILIGTNNSNLAACSTQDFSSFSSIFTLSSATDSLGGLHRRNAIHWGDKLYVIGADGHIYGGVWTSGLTDMHSTDTVQVLAPMGDRIYAATDTGRILRLHGDLDHFEIFYDSVGPREVVYLASFRTHLAVFAHRDDGSIEIYRLPDYSPGSGQPTLHQTACVPGATYKVYDCLFALHDDEIFFSPGRRLLDYDAAPKEEVKTFDVYSYNGAQIRHVASVRSIADSVTAGLVAWQGELLFYETADGSETAQPVIKLLVNDGFTDFATPTIDVRTNFKPILASQNHTLIVTGKNDSAQGVYTADGLTYTDGTLITPYLDMGHPALKKRLHRIVLMLSEAAAVVVPSIKYRTGGKTWTDATADSSSRRVVADVDVKFYQVQLRVDLTQASGNEDVRIQALSALYTINT